jgi:hypothetical protein
MSSYISKQHNGSWTPWYLKELKAHPSAHWLLLTNSQKQNQIYLILHYLTHDKQSSCKKMERIILNSKYVHTI